MKALTRFPQDNRRLRFSFSVFTMSKSGKPRAFSALPPLQAALSGGPRRGEARCICALQFRVKRQFRDLRSLFAVRCSRPLSRQKTRPLLPRERGGDRAWRQENQYRLIGPPVQAVRCRTGVSLPTRAYIEAFPGRATLSCRARRKNVIRRRYRPSLPVFRPRPGRFSASPRRRSRPRRAVCRPPRPADGESGGRSCSP